MKKKDVLSKNQKIVFDYILKIKKPVKAYSILSALKNKGIDAPPKVYRALEKLIELGKIHKIESQNAFVACKSSSCKSSHTTIFSICESCDSVSEVDDPKLSKYLLELKETNGVKLSSYNVELFGRCKSCI